MLNGGMTIRNSKIILVFLGLLILLPIATAWYEESHQFRVPIENRTTQNLSVSIGGSDGFEDSILWYNPTMFNSSLSLYLYYNDSSTYNLVYNETNITTAFEQEGSNISSDIYEDALWVYHFGTNGTIIDSKNNLNGTPANLQWTEYGLFGAGYNFTGTSSEIALTNDPSVLNDGFSLVLWVNNTDTDTDSFLFGFYDAGAAPDQHFMIYSNGVGDGNTHFSMCGSDGSATGINTTIADWNDGNWHMLAFTKSGNSRGTYKVYFDGVEQADYDMESNANTTSITVNTFNYEIGARAGTVGNPYTGLMDEVRIYDRNISANEIQILYNNSINLNNLLGTVESYTPFDNCSSYNNTILTVYLKDEETQNNISGDIVIVLTTSIKSYPFSESNISNMNICLDPEVSSINITEGFIEYQSNDYVVENYYLINTILSNETTTVNLYDLNSSDSQSFEITVLDSSYSGLESAYVKLLRYYPSEDQYKLTEMGKTDSDGKTLLHMVLEDIFYTMIVEEDGEVLYSSEPSKKYCSETPCSLTINTVETIGSIWSAFEGIENLNYNITYNDTIGRVRLQYTDTSGSLSYIRLLVRLPALVSEETTLCNINSSDASGVLFCNLNETAMENATGTFFVDLFVSRSAEQEDVESISLSFTRFLRTNEMFDIFSPGSIGSEGLVWGILLIITIITMGLLNPKLAIIFACLGLGLVGFLGIIQLSYTALMGFICIGILVIIFIRRGETHE